MLPKLLLVDDDEPILRAMARGLRDDYEVKTCGSAAEALREIEAGYTPDAILSDIRMPEMDGIAFREELRKKRPDLLPRFAYCSGSETDGRVADYIAAHQIKVLQKPATPADVRGFLEKLAGR
jgi:CheY-like chemotaxis protein